MKSRFACLLLTMLICQSKGDVTFGDTFNYPTGSLTSNNGGTGWSSSYGNGNSTTVVSNISGTYANSKAVNISNTYTTPNTRSITGTATTIGGSSTSFYVSFLFNSSVAGNNIAAGEAGNIRLGILNLGTSNTFSSQGFGISDGRNGNIQSKYSGFAANTTYLTLTAMTAGTNANTAKLTVYGSTNLLASTAELMSVGNKWAELDNFNSFTISSFENWGDGTVSIAGLAGATDAATSLGFTQSVAVPEPGTLTLGSLALLAGGGAAVRRYRKQRQTKSSATVDANEPLTPIA